MMSHNICLNQFQGSYMKRTLQIESYSFVSNTIPMLVTFKTLILGIYVDYT